MKAGADFVPEAVDLCKQYKTYDWLPPSDQIDKRVHDPILQRRIQGSVDKELKRRGYERLTTGDPDFKVSYYVGVEGKLDIGSVNTYYGYGWYGPTGMVMYSSGRTREYDEGTFILDIVDAPTRDLVWRGIAQAKLTTSLDPNVRQAQIDKAVQKVLSMFPPRG